jgi:3-deoxy-7-phosphoheptulonate synthase
MQNFKLLQAAGQAGKPVLLKRASRDDQRWLHAAEYILSEGNYQVVLCERGIRTFEDYPATPDLSAVVAARSSAICRSSSIQATDRPTRACRADGAGGVAAGADGLMVEMHPNPAEALSDGPQSLDPGQYRELMAGVLSLAAFLRPAV